MAGKFKFQVQDSDLEYLFWQCEKHIALSEKKPPLAREYFPIQTMKEKLVLTKCHLAPPA